MGVKRHLRKLRAFTYIDRAEGNDVVFLAGSGRSGSTWLQNIITASGGWRIMFEPFWFRKVSEVSGWANRQYICEKNGEQYHQAVDTILKGRVRNTWIDQDNCCPFPSRRIIKEIRGNLFLKWLKHEFPEVKLIYLIRNPYDVATSRMGLGWEPDIQVYLDQPQLVADYLESHVEWMKEVTDPYCLHVLSWAVENYVALSSLKSDAALVVFYEDCRRDPMAQAQRIYQQLGIPLPDNAKSVVEAPSRTSSSKVLKNKKKQVYKPNQAQIDTCEMILEKLKLSQLYSGPSTSPKVAADSVLNLF